MKYSHVIRSIGFLWLIGFLGSWCSSNQTYGAQAKEGPKQDKPAAGRIEGPFEWQSQIFPGTVRNYWIYVPQQYQADKPACLMVVQDGLGRAQDWNLPIVMDQLIAEGSIPVCLGLFIDHGKVTLPGAAAQPRFNRSFEYDSLGDRYARFLIEEMIPELKKSYQVSDDPNDRAIAGASSGGICAFNVAWERPDQFRRVLSTIGSFVGLRGGDELATLVRKVEPKPLRIFLEDGSKDLNIYAGDWWTANLQLLSALQFAGYDVQHVWGDGGHNGEHARAILPDALKWLWRDYPRPIVVGTPAKAIIQPEIPGEDWKLLSEGHQFTEGPAMGPDGSLYFVDPPKNQIFQIDAAGKVREFISDSGNASGLMMGPDGKLYACQSGKKQIVRYDRNGVEEVLVRDAPCNDLVVLPNGLYYTDPGAKKIWFVTFEGDRKVVDEGIDFANGLIVSPDHSLLHIADSKGMFTYSFQIQPNGDLRYEQTFGHLHTTYGKGDCWADGMSMDLDGNLYVATNIGVQILDPLGRVNKILLKPQPGPLSNVVLAGTDRDLLVVTCGDKVFQRRIKAKGSASWEAPTLPRQPGL